MQRDTLPGKEFSLDSLIGSTIETILLDNPYNLLDLTELPALNFRRFRGRKTLLKRGWKRVTKVATRNPGRLFTLVEQGRTDEKDS